MVANLTSFETLDHREYVAFGVLERTCQNAWLALDVLALGVG
jgi:hypothetical protein